jgi:choline dehydrogenase-like flavoprotein
MIDTEILVVGSGPGGALTATRLAEAGREVLVLEEGDWIDVGEHEPFSLEQMAAQYRNAGLTVALGRPPIVYSEGRCAGGGSEVNSGLYHRPDSELLADWSRRYGIRDLGPGDLDEHAREIEKTLSISTVPGRVTPASSVLERGAAELGWASREIPRWMVYRDGADATDGERQSMTRTYLPRARNAGASILTGVRVEKLVARGPHVVEVRATRRDDRGGSEPLRIRADHVFVSAGAIQTPALLQRSGVRTNVGRTLAVHPMVKAVARFDEPINVPDDVPVHQVKEFAPNISIGGSASRPGLLGLALAPEWMRFGEVTADWERSSLYYAATRTVGRGHIFAVPGLRDPVVTYRLTRSDSRMLIHAMLRLVYLLFAAGARSVYPSLHAPIELRSRADLTELGQRMRPRDLSLMTVHLCSSVPMGEERARAGTDSFGRVHGFDNLRVNDSSLLPDAPGVNPQGTIMAIASRNCAAFLAGTR